MSIDGNNIATGINNAICEAVTTIADKAISNAGYDKTIQATIVECTDATIGKYKVRYQDTLLYAYATSTDVTYANKASVYVLVPGNDFRQEKTIIGTVQKLGINYVRPVSEKDSYETNGANCIGNSNQIFKISSYENKVITVYEYGSQENLLNVDQEALKIYLYDSDAMICELTAENHLPALQRYQGRYGVIFNLVFMDNTGAEVVRSYTFDNSQMVGNPYKFITPSFQTKIFRIDGINFQYLQSIQIFAKNFPSVQQPPKPEEDNYYNIILSKFGITGGKKMGEEDLNGYKLTFLTTKGNYFSENGYEELPIQAQVRIKGKVAATDSSNIKYYWFRENARIDASSKYYNSIGGQGWECLNKYNIIDSNTVEFIPSTFEYIAVKERFTAKETVIKCCAMYNDETIIENTIPIKNIGSQYDIKIASSNGTQFYYDSGETNLQCSIEWEPDDNGEPYIDTNTYNYYWSITNNNNSYTLLEEETSPMLNVQASSITDFSTYTCTVYLQQEESELYFGSAQIRITNSLEAPAQTMVVINNGTKVFKYSESGVSPTAKSQPNPEILHPLTFTVYDESRKEITADFKTVSWKVPRKDTMISIKGSVEPVLETEEYFIYNTRELVYEIDERFNSDKNNNDIILAVECRDLKLVEQTHFTFTKEGNIGTNGTNYYCEIDYNFPQNDNYEKPAYPMVWKDAAGKPHRNFEQTSETWFKVRLWEGNAEVTDEIESEEWKVLANKYSSSLSDESHFTVIKDEKSGAWKFNVTGLSAEATAADIIQVKVKHNGKTYYATKPIVFKEFTDETIEWVPRTGFDSVVYHTDGTHPAYNNNYPFEVTFVEDAQYEWIAKGFTTEDMSSLLQVSPDGNKAIVKPASLYDGLCVNTSIGCRVTKDGKQLAYINIPIHMYHNRFGQEALNGWDGNSIQLDQQGGHIFSPQVGAGEKDSNNRFTGVLLGKVKEHSNSQELVGLLGYNEGIRSIFLDSKTGKAEFGVAGGGQIILDPRDKTAQIYSSDYSTINKKGMLIDFTKPEIKFGSGYFNVDSEGKLTAKRGEIAGWNIGDSALTKGNVGISSDNSASTNIAFWAGASTASNGKFKVDFAGKMTSTEADITGKITATSGTIGGWHISGNNIQNASENPTILLTPSKISLGSEGEFTVKKDGSLKATKAEITGKVIATSGEFTGKITASDGTIGGWSIGTETLKGGNVTLNKNGNISGKDWSITNAGVATFKNVNITGGSVAGSTVGSGINGANINGSSVTANKLNVDTLADITTVTGTLVAGNLTVGAEGYLRFGDNDLYISKKGNVGIGGDSKNNSAFYIESSTGDIYFGSAADKKSKIKVYGRGGGGPENASPWEGIHTGATFEMAVQRSLTDRIILYFIDGICVGYSQN